VKYYLFLIFIPVFIFAIAPADPNDDSPSCCPTGYYRAKSTVSVGDCRDNSYHNEYHSCLRVVEFKKSDCASLFSDPDGKLTRDFDTSYSCRPRPAECDDNQSVDENGNCIDPEPDPDPECGPDRHWQPSPDGETGACVCDNGLPEINGECQTPTCPPVFQSLPLFKIAQTLSDCDFFPLSDSAALDLPDGSGVCCYGQPDLNETDPCPPNSIEIDGKCYPIEPQSDKNDTDPYDCPDDQYWDFMANGGEGGCLPFFPDDNGTAPGGTNPGGDGSSGSNDENGTDPGGTNPGGSDSNGTAPGGSGEGGISNDDYEEGLKGYGDKLLSYGENALNGYILVRLPVTVVGGCDGSLSKSMTILGRSYTIDISDGIRKFDSQNGLIKSIVLFLFAISGVVIVLSGRSE
jgi:hypothetical protein